MKKNSSAKINFLFDELREITDISVIYEKIDSFVQDCLTDSIPNNKWPKKLYRNDDGYAFHLNGDGMYSTFSKEFGLGLQKHKYSTLIRLGFKRRLKDCKITLVKKTNSDCGDDE